jgi:hypothetical protein
MTALSSKADGTNPESEILKKELLLRLDQLVFDLFGSYATRVHRGFVVRTLEDSRRLNLKVSRIGPNAGRWTDLTNGNTGDVITLIQLAQKLDLRRALGWASSWLGRTATKTVTKLDYWDVGELPVRPDSKDESSSNQSENANRDFLSRRQRYLREYPLAITWLNKNGVRSSTMQAFHLGLSTEYIDVAGLSHSFALVAPVINGDGLPLKFSIYINMPGVTLNPTSHDQWMKGSTMTYYAGAVASRKTVFVCERVKDLWLTWQALNEYKVDREILLIASTHVGQIPDEWRSSAFWHRFDMVYLGYDNDDTGEETANQITRIAGHETFRVRPAINRGKSWSDFWQSGGTLLEFQATLKGANVISQEVSASSEPDTKIGRYEYKPIDIATAFHQGHLYYPIRTLTNLNEISRDVQNHPSVKVVTKIETVVVRSDRTIHSVREDPAPKGTPPEERVLRLTDGTLIESRPKASIYSTWSWESIKAYRDGRSKPRELRAILADVMGHLRQSVWLPFDVDFSLLTLLVPVTYAQAIFQSVPLILVVGPPGSGKSALGRAMCRLSANAALIGQISTAAVARLINQTNGFIVMDDLEAIGKRSGKDAPQFGELVQALKLSYNKETSWKIWTDVSRGMKVERLNFFGVKMINNTSGTDHVLGSRMLRVRMRKIPEDLKADLGVSEQVDIISINRLRDELHTWTFSNVALIDEIYRRQCLTQNDRITEITDPLRVFAEIAGDMSLAQDLDQALATANQPVNTDDPVELLKEAMRRMVKEGYKEVSTTHVALEMKAMAGERGYSSLESNGRGWQEPAWVGRQLRTNNLIDSKSSGGRQWIFGSSLRTYPIKEQFIAKVLGSNGKMSDYVLRKPADFCGGCSHCRYQGVGYPIMELRLKAERKMK